MHSRGSEHMATGLGTFSKQKFNALINLRSASLAAFRTALMRAGYTEVTTSSLVNIAGSCENPYASFRLNYYGRDAHLSQSAQLQLEALVIRLKRGVFTINNSFREEHYDDPETAGRRLSEFTLIEAERPYEQRSEQNVLEAVIADQETLIKSVVNHILTHYEEDVRILGGNVEYLRSVSNASFAVISYDDALKLISKTWVHIDREMILVYRKSE